MVIEGAGVKMLICQKIFRAATIMSNRGAATVSEAKRKLRLLAEAEKTRHKKLKVNVVFSSPAGSSWGKMTGKKNMPTKESLNK